MSTITTPATIKEAVAELDGIGTLLTATEWHRAAIVATFVRLDEGHGGRLEMGKTAHFLSARAFAELGIRGLRSHHTVVHYVECWLDEHDGNYPTRGAAIDLPDVEWPPQPRNAGTRMPQSIDLAVTKLVEQHGASAVINAIEELVDESDERTVANPRPNVTLDERWEIWLKRINAAFLAGARLEQKTDEANIALHGYALLAHDLYVRLTERRIDADIRALLDTTEVGR